MTTLATLLTRARARLGNEAGFTMIIAMGVLLVTSLLVAGTLIALESDAHLSQTDLDGKRAYYAARAGLNAYLYQINQNSSYWQTCANDSASWTTIPGNTSGQQYSYAPVPANGNTSCNSSNIINSMIDTNSGSLSMKFYGQSGTNPTVQRGIIASFKRASPLDYLWYTVYESLDSSIGSTYSGCGVWYRQGRSSVCNIQWATGDAVNGPMYTQDQLWIPTGNAPTFGRTSADKIESLASNSVCASGCGSATFNGTPVTGVNVSEPSDNSGLLSDATNYGKVYSGTTTITLNGNYANITNCPTSTTCTTTSNLDLTQYPIIYVQNATGCSPPQYTPYGPSYASYGCNGDIYVSGNYTTSLTIASANNIIVTGNITTTGSGSTLSGNAVLGLVANQFVRVQHGVPSRTASLGSCPSGADTIDLNNLTIDAAILALQHSFIVDNFDCGKNSSGQNITLGTLTVNGAIAQKFRGAVGTGGTSPTSGYLKAYTYDDRLKYLAPPYLFDILTAGWDVSRETQCVPNGSSSATAC